MVVDLHLHTNYSDGHWSPSELVEHASELRLTHIAVTDHDTIDGVAEAKQAAAGRLEVIPGVEISTVWKTDDGRLEDIHILGYFIDCAEPQLLSLLARQKKARARHVHDIVEQCRRNNIELTFEMVSKLAGAGSIGRPHLARAIVAAGAAQVESEAFQQYLLRGAPFFVEREFVATVEAINAINNAGGIASLAHPWKMEGIEPIILSLKQAGLKAIEAYHRKHSLELVRRYIRFANRHGLAITGGSDCHGPARGGPSIGCVSVPYEVVRSLQQLVCGSAKS